MPSVRISQNVLTCPTAACFNLMDSDPFYKLGRKMPFFGDGFQRRIERHGRRVCGDTDARRRVRHRPAFRIRRGTDGRQSVVLRRRRGIRACRRRSGVEAIEKCPGVIMPFPGGMAGSGSKAGSKYSFTVASTYERFCPTLRETLGAQSLLPEGVNSVMEIIINGRNIQTISTATQAAIAASVDSPGLLRLSAGNYGGRLGKSFIYLHADKQPPFQ